MSQEIWVDKAGREYDFNGCFKKSFNRKEYSTGEAEGPDHDGGVGSVIKRLSQKEYPLEEVKPKLHIYSFMSINDHERIEQHQIFQHDQESLQKAATEVGNILKRSENAKIIPHPPRTIFVIAHGFKNSGSTKWVQEMKSALLTKLPTSVVILVDWHHWDGVIKTCNYGRSAATTLVMGKWLAGFLYHLRPYLQKDKGGILWGIGHSLGAHLMGICGRHFREFGGVMDRVTGLDPAGPFFEEVGGSMSAHKLSKLSAAFVDVIHTDGKTVMKDVKPKEPREGPEHDSIIRKPMHLGTMEALGHMDFYPNFGQIYSMANFNREKISHSLAHSYFIQSINTPQRCPEGMIDPFSTDRKLKHAPIAKRKPTGIYRETDKMPDKVRMGFHCKRRLEVADDASECFYLDIAPLANK